MKEETRCPWALISPEYTEYHDNDWGRPVRDDRRLFEILALESMQAGLSWLTVLRKREGFREAFDGFDPEKVALYDERKICELTGDSRIVRNRLKIEAAVNNARRFLETAERHGSFSRMIWDYVGDKPLDGRWARMEDVPATTGLSHTVSKDLKKMGFKFVGPTAVYSFMQAAGIVNDHIAGCSAGERCRDHRDMR